ncbi:hypothetical protein N7532_004764 [Penicillium argentinense]|uniref:Transcription factor domain-containing protein n=1 Tax=Penicillium argentinense TaxID=1131581 RepID=A0A9W9KF69_9EURO|nr:uncharacterized protein N7532_004764 [Penicillium argentinense]KAJ5104235.1 hypothetical protein N7532_004764 [Penicillium argentinense]
MVPYNFGSLDDDLFADLLYSWDNEIPELPRLSGPTSLTFPFKPAISEGQPPVSSTKGSPCSLGASDGRMGVPVLSMALPQNSPEEIELHIPTKRLRRDELPTHLLAQHYSRALTGRFSFKQPEWTFYTYFFHRFAGTHFAVRSAILAWTAANLFFAQQASSLDDTFAHYHDSLTSIVGKYDVAFESWQAQEHNMDVLHHLSDDDMDALFVASFFLALTDLALARSSPLRKFIRFIAAILNDSELKQNLTGVQARITSWVRGI